MSTKGYRFGGRRNGAWGWAQPAKFPECTPAILGILGPDAPVARPTARRRRRRGTARAPPGRCRTGVREAKTGKSAQKRSKTGDWDISGITGNFGPKPLPEPPPNNADNLHYVN
ncbi:hypothetical protein GCM10023081_29180 [Arthrobacter ginkgonis]|uniref:Uncharacterized protein n=1 Tax=Arthrobacter ginkgonis TaxID=1630594 RepID=A0ABP7CKC1_9MICC